LDLVILKVFSNLKYSMMIEFTHVSGQGGSIAVQHCV